jgi:dolichol-phosphate mannosyltransferase
MGLGSAYIMGFKKALEMGADAIVQMDSDFSHDPQVLLKMHEKINSCDVVSGSRYVPGGSLDTEWPIWRKALSMFGNFYAKIILRIPVKDMTTGFRMWSRQAMQRMPLDQIRSNGYAFQVEMIYVASLLGFNIIEEPIYFANRTAGESKITFQIQMEGAIRTLEMQWHYRDLKKNNKKPRTTV